MILASSLRRASEEPHSSTALNRLVEALFLPWSVSMSSDAPYWRPPTPRGQYGRSTGDLWSLSPFLDSFLFADQPLRDVQRALNLVLALSFVAREGVHRPLAR